MFLHFMLNFYENGDLMNKQFDLRDHLKKLIADSPLSQNEIANHLGISSSYISKFLNNKQEIAFWMPHKLVTYLDKDNELFLMSHFCESMKRKENLRVGLEYSHSKHLKSLTQKLIKVCSNDKNEENKEWAYVYEWQLMSKKNVFYSEEDYLKNLKGLKTKTDEMKALLTILEMYCFFFNEKYELALYHVNQAKNLLKDVSDPFVKSSFTARLNEALCYIYLKLENNVCKARETAFELIDLNLGPNYLITGYFILGLSYIKESLTKTEFYYKKVLEISEQTGRTALITDTKEQLYLARLYWKKEIDLEWFTNEFFEAYTYKKSLDKFYDNPRYLPYILLFEGITEKNKEKLFMSREYFLKQKDMFRASIPKFELEKLGLKFRKIKGGEYV